MKISGNSRLTFKATKEIHINGMVFDAECTRASVNGKATNDKVSIDCESLYIIGGEIESGCTAYNIFEQRQAVEHPIKTVYVKGIKGDCPSLLHNVLNFYNLADDAAIFIEDCEFNLNVANSNVMRISNYTNAKNVSIRFSNVRWTYEPTGGSEEDFQWAGLLLYQAASSKENAYISEEDAYVELRTWSFVFEDCYYNGEKVTGNNFGEHNQVMIMYNMGKSGVVADPVADGNLHLIFY